MSEKASTVWHSVSPALVSTFNSGLSNTAQHDTHCCGVNTQRSTTKAPQNPLCCSPHLRSMYHPLKTVIHTVWQDSRPSHTACNSLEQWSVHLFGGLYSNHPLKATQKPIRCSRHDCSTVQHRHDNNNHTMRRLLAVTPWTAITIHNNLTLSSIG